MNGHERIGGAAVNRNVLKNGLKRVALAGAGISMISSSAQAAEPVLLNQPGCGKPVYLTFDTGHMGVAPLIAEVLQRHQVKATFFMANERTVDGSSLDDHWAPWWKARADEGHLFGTHTWDHVAWRRDLSDGRFEVKASFGPQAGKTQVWSTEQYCAEMNRSAQRFTAMTGGRHIAPIYRAPGGKFSPRFGAAIESCGYKVVPWSPAGFLGDELPSERYPNQQLLDRALRDIRPGDILAAHLGIWSRKDAWAPAVLEPLVNGLLKKGYCFATIAEHPQYRDWIHSASARP
jgi:peptidoglycan-N-acetylmuramic acid deacetylase